MERLERALFCLEQGFELQFRLGPTLQGREVQVYTNYPTNDHQFDREKFHSLDWVYPNGRKDDCDKYCRLDLKVAGSYQYYFSCGETEKVSGGHIVVDPVVKVGANDDILPLDCISSQTYLARSLGPLDEWRERLRVAKETGYNMIHLTPLQRLGVSGSGFSLADQLELNPSFSPEGQQYTWDHVAGLVEGLRRDWGMVCITDVVYNHTAVDSEWIHQHPECGYNLVNAPDLKPAWLLDRALWHLSCEVADGKHAAAGVPALIQHEQHVDALRALLQQLFSRLRLWEFLQVDVGAAVEQLSQLLTSGLGGRTRTEQLTQLKIVQDPQHQRFGNTVDMNSALDIFVPLSGSLADIQESCRRFRRKLEELNASLHTEMSDLAKQVTNCIVGTVVHERVAAEGPKLGPVTRERPLCPSYFVFPFEEMTLEEEVQLMDERDKACHFLAHDGFKMGDEAFTSSAARVSEVYLRRELVCQSDTIKLRYGEKPDDCPYLWARMKKYTEMMAKIFSGICLVNCHATPLHVTQAMLAAARAVRANLYVIAELSPSTQPSHNVFVNHLGITSLFMLDQARCVRPDLLVLAELFMISEELQNVCVTRLAVTWLIRDVGGATDCQGEPGWMSWFGREPVGGFIQPSLRPLIPAAAHTMFMDSSLHSPRPAQGRSVLDYLPSSALVSMACCAASSTRGYDELLPHQALMAMEVHQYSSWNPDVRTSKQVDLQTGMIAGRLALNKLHQELVAGGFSQVCVEQLGGGVLVVTRHCPTSHQSVVAVLRMAGTHPADPVPPVLLPCQVEEVLLEARTVVRHTDSHTKDDKNLNGLPEYTMELREHIQLEDSEMVRKTHKVSEHKSVFQEIRLERFTPGCIIVFRVTPESRSRKQLGALRRHLIQFGPQYRMDSLAERSPPSALTEPLMMIMSRLTLADMNMLLYRCDAEEWEDGRGCYDVPSWLSLNYGGLQGVMSSMADIRPQNNLAHPVCDNLRRGDWMMDFISDRLLMKDGALGEVGHWLQAMFSYLKNIPRYLVPCYFDAIIQGAYTTALEAAFTHMSSFIQDGSSLVKQLALGSVQFFGGAGGSALPALSPHLEDHLSDITNQEETRSLSLAAGLPHLCVGGLRCWGRDTFIALRGLMLLTGRHLEARNIILAFAGTLRYGLIPNQLGHGGSACYNCRDAVWWWLQSVQHFCALVPNGVSILKCPVSRMFPTNVSAPQPAGVWDQPLLDVIQEAMQRHMQGIQFRESNAGPQLDGNMADEGFHVEAGVDQSTGFVFGGNRYNCGTWMDKMGESERAHNKGVPATPRDGSAVELVGLCKSAVRWLVKLHEEGHFPYKAVTICRGGHTYSVSYVEWDNMIQENFEKKFYISHDPHDPEEKHPQLVHKRGIYKDSVGASSPWCDYQLRPNFPIAMVVAPELFTVEKAWESLSVAEQKLLGPLGMKTLDPDDLVYSGVYDSNLDDENFNRAKGFNRHQGPEWVWPIGYFLRAKLYFAKKMGKETFDKTVNLVKTILSQHAVHLDRSPWKGLPDMTNERGQRCPSASSESHASSFAAILEVLYDL
ncbi:glycogen debranching enzyme-like [Aulostomus maculatus]